jgi:hypothetical protein
MVSHEIKIKRIRIWSVPARIRSRIKLLTPHALARSHSSRFPDYRDRLFGHSPPAGATHPVPAGKSRPWLAFTAGVWHTHGPAFEGGHSIVGLYFLTDILASDGFTDFLGSPFFPSSFSSLGRKYPILGITMSGH